MDLLLVTYSADHPANAWFAAVCAIVGSVAGSAFLFGIARKGGQVFLSKYIATGTGKRLHAWFEEYGLITVFVPAISLLPLPLKVPVFCAGALEVRWVSFLSVILAARAIRYFALAALGREFGRSTFAFLASHLLVVFGIAVGLGVVAVVVLRLIVHKGPHGHHPTTSSQGQ
ncbi:MAG: YqaA family protein [Bryobacteraceae bacterium]